MLSPERVAAFRERFRKTIPSPTPEAAEREGAVLGMILMQVARTPANAVGSIRDARQPGKPADDAEPSGEHP